MKHLMHRAGAALGAAVLASTLAVSGAKASDLYRLTSVAALSPYIVNTAIATVVNRNVPGIELQVNATGAATRHMLDAALGRNDFFFGSATINWMMLNDIGPFAEVPNSGDLEENLGMIFTYEIGPYHYTVRADSDIQTLHDLRGKRVFVGPPGGAATLPVLTAIEAITGLTREDMDVATFGVDAAVQAFQDDRLDLIVLSANVPNPSVQQFAMTKRIRFLDIETDKVPYNPERGSTRTTIAPDAYGPNQVNTDPVRTHGALVNFSAGMHVPEEVVYQVTRAIWENLDAIHETAPWLPGTVTQEAALSLVTGRLHPGAERYYREMGWEIPDPMPIPRAN
ncbi:MAG: TAXI family TRAP transporter solute-binding subunit [Rhodobacteraceae bacterium]|nr:TAXI family TRAP transporter solute-binding subunit [Paracoccaceae bacterium]